MYSTSASDSIVDVLFIVVFVIFSVGAHSYRVYRRRNRSFSSSKSSVLMAYYTDGAKEMMPIRKGKIAGMNYSAIAIIGHADDYVELQTAALLYMVTLSYKTDVHLLGIPKKSGVVQLNPVSKSSIIEPVVLEGDYPDFFSLYTEKGMQTDVRYALDPKAMLFTIDFCQSHSWEIADGCLYFVQGNSPQHKDDPTYMFEDIQKFVEEVRPIVSSGVENIDIYAQTASKLLAAPREVTYRCPFCRELLEDKKEYYRCMKGHGLLLVGAKLSLVKSGEIPNPPGDIKDRRLHIKCPACNTGMEHVQLGNRETFIDTCNSCPYRWLDAGELSPAQK